MARLWARTTTYDTVEVGDELPILVKWETGETIGAFAALVSAAPEQVEGQASEVEDDCIVLASQALVAYTTELLEKGCPLSTITAQGSALSLRILEPVKPEDTISLSGRVAGKQREGDSGSVDCVIRIENQDNALVAEATARIVLERDLAGE